MLPMEAWLTTRGIKTLAVRMERHCHNAQAIAEALVEDSRVEQVYYPGLATHAGPRGGNPADVGLWRHALDALCNRRPSSGFLWSPQRSSPWPRASGAWNRW